MWEHVWRVTREGGEAQGEAQGACAGARSRRACSGCAPQCSPSPRGSGSRGGRCLGSRFIDLQSQDGGRRADAISTHPSSNLQQQQQQRGSNARATGQHLPWRTPCAARLTPAGRPQLAPRRLWPPAEAAEAEAGSRQARGFNAARHEPLKVSLDPGRLQPTRVMSPPSNGLVTPSCCRALFRVAENSTSNLRRATQGNGANDDKGPGACRSGLRDAAPLPTFSM